MEGRAGSVSSHAQLKINFPSPTTRSSIKNSFILESSTIEKDVPPTETIFIDLEDNFENSGGHQNHNVDTFASNIQSQLMKVRKSGVSMDFQNKSNVRKSNTWEPPISCQRRFSHISRDQQFFPIELTSRDYFSRTISLVVMIIELLDIQKMKTAPFQPSQGLEGKAEEFMNLILANVSQKKCFEVTNKLHLLLSFPSKKLSEQLLGSICAILDLKDQLLETSQHSRFVYDDCILSNAVSNGIEAISSFLVCLQGYLDFNIVKRVNPAITIDTVLLEIKDLHTQFKLQQVFQSERAAYFGWRTHQFRSFNNVGVQEAREDSQTSDDGLIIRCESLQQQIGNIVSNPQQTCLITLIIRIFTIIEDLTALSNDIGAIGDYQEASRLRQLSASIDLSINSNYSSLPHLHTESNMDMNDTIYFDFRKYLDELYILKNDVYVTLLQLSNCFETLRQGNDFPRLLRVEKLINQLTEDYQKFLVVTRKVSLLNQSSVQQRIHLEGTSFVNADFLFASEFEGEAVSVASLLIQSQSEYLLRAIETWQELSALNRSSFNLSNHLLLTSQLESDQRSQLQSITDVSSYVQSDWNSVSQNFSSATTGKGKLRRETLEGFTTSLVLSNTSQYKKEFSQLIFDTLHSFETLLHQLNLLLTTEAMAHSELICRLIGIRDDLYSLIEVNTHATNQVEAERLLELVNVIDNTIDADEQDHLYHHPYMMISEISTNNLAAATAALGAEGGTSLNAAQALNSSSYSSYVKYLASIANHEIGRGRKRIDNIYHFLKVLVEGMNELIKLKSRAKSINDFIAVKSIDQILDLLKTKIEMVEKSITPFHLLDHDNDISSHGNALQLPKINQNLILDINERIAREGTDFLTSDFLFSYCCGQKGHSIGSLAIVSGAGAVLRCIKTFWPSFTVLGGSNNVTETGKSSSLNPETSTDFTSSVDFRSANTLRLLGFDAKTLKLAGFSTVDILTAGFTAEQLKTTGFSIELIRSIPHFDHYFTRAVGYQLETQAKILLEFFLTTGGTQWRKSDSWGDLVNSLSQSNILVPNGNATTAILIPTTDNANQVVVNSKSQWQFRLFNLLKKCFGVSIKEPQFDPMSSMKTLKEDKAVGNGNINHNQSLTTSAVSQSSNSASNLLQHSSGATVSSTTRRTNPKSAFDPDSSEVTHLILPQNSLQGLFSVRSVK